MDAEDESMTTMLPTPLAAEELNRYQKIMERLFFAAYSDGVRAVEFKREDMVRAAGELGIVLPKNLGDVIYSFRYRALLPESIRRTALVGESWIIRSPGRSRYRFELATTFDLTPNKALVEIKVPDATPGVVAMYASTDEQGLLAKLRYNRLIDIFTSVTCYSLQNHLRTTVPGIGQVETDEIYVGIDQHGAHYVMPVQAKGGRDKIGVVQIEQDVALCAVKFPGLICRPIAAQFMSDDLIALFEFVQAETGIALAKETHYRLVAREDMTDRDLATYRQFALPRLA